VRAGSIVPGESEKINDAIKLNTRCLSGLGASFNSTKHIRLIEVQPGRKDEMMVDFSVFKTLKILGINPSMVHALSKWTSSSTPPVLETLHLVYYSYLNNLPIDFSEQGQIAKFLRTGTTHTLTSVMVPSRPIRFDNTTEMESRLKSQWTATRSQFQGDEIFKSGRMDLKIHRPGQIGEFKNVNIGTEVFGVKRISFNHVSRSDWTLNSFFIPSSSWRCFQRKRLPLHPLLALNYLYLELRQSSVLSPSSDFSQESSISCRSEL